MESIPINDKRRNLLSNYILIDHLIEHVYLIQWISFYASIYYHKPIFRWFYQQKLDRDLK